ncbi:aldehyde ferredoxin oxidoreductase C-terminal domain-containing protein [Chloroflexota bacterium]
MNEGYRVPWAGWAGERMAKYAARMKRDLCYGCIGACPRAIYRASDGSSGKFVCLPAVLLYHERAYGYYGKFTDVPFFAANLCDNYGLDTEVIHAMMPWLVRCREAGVLTDEGTGIPLSKVGSIEFIETLVRKISLREGFGEILAQGIHKAADLIGQGARELIGDDTSKDGKHSTYCPRMHITHGILYAMESRQPVEQLHEIGLPLIDWVDWVKKVEGSYLSTGILREIGKRFWGGELAVDFSTYEGKALAATKIQNREYVKESLILCDFMWPISRVRCSEDHIGDPTIESSLLSAVTGKEMGEDELYEVGERIFNLQRAILLMEGRDGRDSDNLPEIYYTLPLQATNQNPDCLAPGEKGEIISRKGVVVDRAKFEKMKDEYYQLRGWDVATGLPTEPKLSELGLHDVAKKLASKKLVV